MLKRIVALTAVVLAVAGCELATGPDQDGLAPDEVQALADGLVQDGMTESGDTTSSTASMMASSRWRESGMADSSTIEITRTHDCVRGGQVTMSGTRTRVRDRETRTGWMELTATRAFTDCARPLADTTVTITLNGDVTMHAYRAWEAGSWNGTQEITIEGTIDWATDDDRSGTCVIDIEATFEPGSGHRNVMGEVCGEDLGGLGGWSFGPMGNGPHSGGHRHDGGGHGGGGGGGR